MNIVPPPFGFGKGKIFTIYLRDSSDLVAVPDIDPVYCAVVTAAMFNDFLAHGFATGWEYMFATYPDAQDYCLLVDNYEGWGVLTRSTTGGINGRPKTIRYIGADDYLHPVRRSNQALIDAINFTTAGATDWLVQGLKADAPSANWNVDQGATRITYDYCLIENVDGSYGIRFRQSTDPMVQRSVLRQPIVHIVPGPAVVDTTGVQFGNVDLLINGRALDNEIYDWGDQIQPTDGPTAFGDVGWTIKNNDLYVTPEYRYCDADGTPNPNGVFATSENSIDIKTASDLEQSYLIFNRCWGMRRNFAGTSAGDLVVTQRYARDITAHNNIWDDGPAGQREEVWASGNLNTPRNITWRNELFFNIKNRSGLDTGSCVQPVNNDAYNQCLFGNSDSIVNKTVLAYYAGGPTFGTIDPNYRNDDTVAKNPAAVGVVPYIEPPNLVLDTPVTYIQYQRKMWTGPELSPTPIAATDKNLAILFSFPLTPMPTAAFSVANTPGSLSIVITDESVANAGKIASVSYTFGDGASSLNPNPSHTFPGRGTYTITQVVVDTFGASKTTWRTVTITDSTIPDITVTQVLGASSTTDGSSFNVGSITPVAGRDYYLAFESATTSGTPNIPTASGAGMTWEEVESSASTGRRVTWLHARADGGAFPGAITVDLAAQTNNSAAWYCFELTDVDDRAAYQQRNAGLMGGSHTSTSPAMALLAPLENSHNVMLAALVLSNNTAITGDPAFTNVNQGVSAPVARLGVSWAKGQVSAVSTWTSGSSYAWAVLEIRAA